MATITINTTDLGVAWELGKEYKIVLPEGFIVSSTDATANKANDNLATFTMPANPPLISSTNPVSGSLGNFENEFATIITDRALLFKNTGSLQLYKVSTPSDILIHTFNINDPEVTIVGGSIKIYIAGLLESNQSYYVLADSGIVVDSSNFAFAGITSSSEFTWTTDAAWSADLTVPSASQYNEDHETLLLGNSRLVELSYFTGNYTVVVTPSSGAITTMSSSGSGGTSIWSNGELTISGTGSEVNSHLNTILFTPVDDFTGAFTITYTVTNPNAVVSSKTQDMTVNQTNQEVLNVTLVRSAYVNSATSIFASNPIQIGDSLGNPNDNYIVSLNCAEGPLGVGADTPVATLTLTGVKSVINAQLTNVKFYPNSSFTANTTCQYTQTRNGVQQINTTFDLNHIASANPSNTIASEWVFQVGDNHSFSPTPEQILFGKFNILMVAGGGSGGAVTGGPTFGASGGGGAGGVYVLENQTFTLNEFPKLLTVGGSSGNGDGGDTIGFGYTATGGKKGKYDVVIYNGGNSFDYNFSGGAAGNPTTKSGTTVTGTINWSASQGYVPAWPTRGGVGGSNLTQPSFITNPYSPYYNVANGGSWHSGVNLYGAGGPGVAWYETSYSTAGRSGIIYIVSVPV